MAKKRKDSKGRILKTGERQRPDGSYEFRQYRYGKVFNSIYAPTLEELRRREEQVARDRSDGIRVNASKMTLDNIYDVWCETRRGLKDNTFQNYKYLYTQFVSPEIGKFKVTKIIRSDIKRFYNKIIDSDGVKLSTAESIQTVLHQVLQFAVDDNYIRTNPADGALKEFKMSHQYDSEKRRALTIDQQKLLVSFLDESETYRRWRPIITVMLGTGMRVGEVTGLRWKDIDLDAGTIDINHTLVFYSKGHKQTYAINSTKTPASRRVIPMLDSVREAFYEEMRNQDASGIRCRSVIDGYTDFIFLNRFGDVLNLGVINKALRRIMIDCNDKVLEKHKGDDMPVLLPRFSCHTFRHTFTTRMCESGMNIKVIQGILGHTDISTTMNIYVDITRELENTAMEDFTKYLEEKHLEEKYREEKKAG